MSFDNVYVKPNYSTQFDDVIEDFYNPVLSETFKYKRASAYFDANILSLYSRGIENVVKNGGHIYFIFSDEISEDDFETMKSGYEMREKIEQGLLDKITVDYPSRELSNLAYLIANDYVDVKIAINSKGLFHDKFGIMTDDKGNKICFIGSNNETKASAEKNSESFVTAVSLDNNPRSDSQIFHFEKEFDDLWNDRYEKTVVIDIPECVKTKLVSYSRGKVIYYGEEDKNCIFMSIDEKRGIYWENRLNNKDHIYPQSSFYQTRIEVHEDRLVGERHYLFPNASLATIESLINSFQNIIDLVNNKLGTEYEVFISRDLRRNLDARRLKMASMRSVGIAIKKHNPELQDDFDRFCNEVKPLMVRDLKEPQLWGSYHIARLHRSANFSVPGSGKTSIVLGAFAYLNNREEVNKILMIGPMNSFRSWKVEFQLCFGNKKRMRCFDYQQMAIGKSRAEKIDLFNNVAKSSNLVLMNYESVPGNFEELKDLIDEKTLIVFDEVHRIKTVGGFRASSALELCNQTNAKYRVVLTGTPIPNGYIDISNFMHILFPDDYDSFFGLDDNKLSNANFSASAENEINQLIYPFFCVTTKDDLNVPPADPNDYESCYCLADENDEELYSIVRRNTTGCILLQYVRLIQASCNPSLILKSIDLSQFNSFYDPDELQEEPGDFEGAFSGELLRETYSEEEKQFIENYGMSPKFYAGIDKIVEELESGQDHVIAWGVFIDTLYKISDELEERGISTRVINGSVPLQEREAILDDFQNDRFQVLIANPATLAESVSLHHNCHVAVYFEYTFNLVHMLQSQDRIHRFGLPAGQRTHYYFPVMDNPDAEFQCIDMKILNRLDEKKERQKRAITNDGIELVVDDVVEDLNALLR